MSPCFCWLLPAALLHLHSVFGYRQAYCPSRAASVCCTSTSTVTEVPNKVASFTFRPSWRRLLRGEPTPPDTFTNTQPLMTKHQEQLEVQCHRVISPPPDDQTAPPPPARPTQACHSSQNKHSDAKLLIILPPWSNTNTYSPDFPTFTVSLLSTVGLLVLSYSISKDFFLFIYPPPPLSLLRSNNPAHRYYLATDPVTGQLYVSDTNSRRIYRPKMLSGARDLISE